MVRDCEAPAFIAEVVPVTRDESAEWKGSMRGSVEILGDVVSPAADEGEWEALGR